jgi:hypothetical protein
MAENRLSRGVYWRRRVVVLGIPLALLAALVLWAVNRGGHDATAAPPAPRVTTAPLTTSAAAHGVPDCVPPALALGITADSADVAAGVMPTFTVTITNAGSTQCVVDAGDLQREVLVVSGTDRVWSSKDCASGSPARSLLLAPGMTDTTQLAWNRIRSAAGCPSGLPAPKPGTYQVTVALAGTSGGPTVFRLR